MINDIPSSDEYKNVAIECLIQAYNNIFSVDNSLNNQTPRKEIWNYHQIVLRTAIVLVHQGVEALMKSEICKKTPLLLVDKKRSEWKSLPIGVDESFTDFNTIGGEDLLRTFYACVNAKKINENFLTLYEEVRVKRNRIVHGIGTEMLSPEYVLKLILDSFTYLLGKDSFWEAVSNKFYSHPGFVHEDSDIEWQDSYQYMRLEYLELFLGRSELRKHFTIDIKTRRYLCPFCTEKGEQITEQGIERPDSKWAFLNPNTSDSTNMSCIVCQTDFGIIREDCIDKDCKGNVKYLLDDDDNEIWICLTCWSEETKKTN